jgi:SAM-dependent methyltransferase
VSETAKLFTDGEVYERLMGRWSRLIGEQFIGWLGIPKGLRWLDVGCGNGAFTEELIARCAPAAVTAIDPSDDQLDFARMRPGAKMAQFQRGDAQALAFGPDTFDVTVMALVLAFLPDPTKAVAEMMRVTKPGGVVATYMWDLPSGGAPVTPIYAAFKSMGMQPPLPPRPQDSTQAVMRELWEGAGLRSVEIREFRIPVTYADFDDFWDSNTVPIGPQGKLIAAMTPTDRDKLRARLRDQLAPHSDGRIVYESFANAVKGRCLA